jgi:hypothetical protein
MLENPINGMNGHNRIAQIPLVSIPPNVVSFNPVTGMPATQMPGVPYGYVPFGYANTLSPALGTTPMAPSIGFGSPAQIGPGFPYAWQNPAACTTPFATGYSPATVFGVPTHQQASACASWTNPIPGMATQPVTSPIFNPAIGIPTPTTSFPGVQSAIGIATQPVLPIVNPLTGIQVPQTNLAATGLTSPWMNPTIGFPTHAGTPGWQSNVGGICALPTSIPGIANSIGNVPYCGPTTADYAWMTGAGHYNSLPAVAPWAVDGGGLGYNPNVNCTDLGLANPYFNYNYLINNPNLHGYSAALNPSAWWNTFNTPTDVFGNHPAGGYPFFGGNGGWWNAIGHNLISGTYPPITMNPWAYSPTPVNIPGYGHPTAGSIMNPYGVAIPTPNTYASNPVSCAPTCCI